MDEIEHSINDNVLEMLTAIYITQRRIYDTLAWMLKDLNEEAADTLISIHASGGFVTPDPSMLVGENGTSE